MRAISGCILEVVSVQFKPHLREVWKEVVDSLRIQIVLRIQVVDGNLEPISVVMELNFVLKMQ